MTNKRIPWRDNGLLLAAVGSVVFVALIGAEFVFQELHYQDPVLNFALQSDSEADSEENDDDVAALTAAEKNQVKRLSKALAAVDDAHFYWPEFQQQNPYVPNHVWREVAYNAAKQDHPQAAEQIFSALLTQDPTAEYLLFQYAKAASRLGDDALAAQRYRDMLRIHANHQAAYINLGLVLARVDQHSEAIRELNKAIELTSGHRKAKAYSIRASSYLALGQYKMAVADFQASVEYRPTHAPTWRKLAKAMLQAGVPDAEAMTALDRSLKLKPDSVIGLHDRARFYWQAGELEQAREDLETIRAIAPDYQPSRWTLLQLYVVMEKENSAEKELKWLRQQQPDGETSKMLSGIAAFIDSDYSKARSAFAEVLEADSDESWALLYFIRAQTRLQHALTDTVLQSVAALGKDQWLRALSTQALADYYLAQEQFADAIARMQALSTAHPQSHYYAYWLGRVYLDAGLPIEAASALQRAVKLDKENTQTQLSLAIAYNRAGQTDLAIKTYQNILRLRANHREALYNFGNILEDLERNAEAIDKFEQLLSFDTDNNSARYLLARLYQEEQNYQQSIALLQEALAEEPTYHRARELLAQVQAERGTLPQALAEVERLLTLDRDRIGGLMLKSDILRDQGQLQAAAEVLWAIPTEDYSRNTLIKIYNIGVRALDAEDFTLAEACNRRVIAVDPTFDKAWVNLTSALLRSQQYSQVIGLLADKQDLLAVNAKITINLAEAYHYTGQSRQAIALLEPLQQQDLLSQEGQLVLAKSYNNL